MTAKNRIQIFSILLLLVLSRVALHPCAAAPTAVIPAAARRLEPASTHSAAPTAAAQRRAASKAEQGREPAHASPAQEHAYMEKFSVDEGLPHTDVSSIVQDAEGYIWIGTYSGLCRYDGNDLKTWDMSNSMLHSSRIRSLRLIANRLYIGTENGGLTIYDTVSDTFVKTLSVPGNCVNSIFPSADGKSVWLCTNDGLSVMRDGPDGYSISSWSSGRVCSTGCAIDGEDVLVGTSSGVGIFNEQDGMRYIKEGVFATSMLDFGDGRIIITAYSGTFIYDCASGTLSALDGLDSRSACLDGAGNIYIATEGHGIMKYSRDLKCTEVITPWDNTLQTSDVELSALFYDASLVLWIGTNGSGCFRSTATNRAFSLWTPFPDPGKNQLVTMYTDSRGRLWMTSRDGNVAVMHGGRVQILDRKSLSMFRSMPVSAIYETADGAMWLGSWDHGAGIIAARDVAAACAGRPFSMKRLPGFPEAISVYKFIRDSNGSIWVTTASGVWRFVSGRWDNLHYERRNPGSLSDDFTTDILSDGDIVWVGTRSGLNRILCSEDGSVRKIDRVHVRSGDSAGEFVSFIHKSADDSLWVSVLGLGLAKLV